jgi:hypothetical protein
MKGCSVLTDKSLNYYSVMLWYAYLQYLCDPQRVHPHFALYTYRYISGIFPRHECSCISGSKAVESEATNQSDVSRGTLHRYVPWSYGKNRGHDPWRQRRGRPATASRSNQEPSAGTSACQHGYRWTRLPCLGTRAPTGTWHEVVNSRLWTRALIELVEMPL